MTEDELKTLRDKLSYRQRRFCEEFIIDYNASAAARRAGYALTWVDRQASALLHNANCMAYIDAIDSNKQSKIVSVDPDYVIQKTIKNIDKAETSNNLTAVFRGLELLARHLGMFIDRTEITGKNGEAIQIEQRAKEDAQKLLETINSMTKKNKDSASKKDVSLL